MLINILVPILRALSEEFTSKSFTENFDDYTTKMNLSVLLSLSLINSFEIFLSPAESFNIITNTLNYKVSQDLFEQIYKESVSLKINVESIKEYNNFLFTVLNYEDRLTFIKVIYACVSKAKKVNEKQKLLVQLAMHLKIKKVILFKL